MRIWKSVALSGLRDTIASYNRNTPQLQGYFNGRKDAFEQTIRAIESADENKVVNDSPLDYFIDVDMDKFPYLITEKHVFRITFSPSGDVARLTIGEFIDKLEKHGLVQFPKSLWGDPNG